MSDAVDIPHVVTVCTVVRNDGDPLERFLAAIDVQSLPAPGFDVVIVDATVSGSIAQRVHTERVLVQVVRTDPTSGHAATLNIAWRAGRGEGIAFLAVDTVPSEMWVEYFSRTLRRGRRLLTGRWLPSVGSLPNSGPASFRLWAVSREAPLVSSEQFGCRRGDLESAGGFDESLVDPRTCDLDLAIRLVESGVDPYFERLLVCQYDVAPVGVAAMLADRAAGAQAVQMLADRPVARARMLSGGLMRRGAAPLALLALLGVVLTVKDRRAALLVMPWWHERTCVVPHAAGPRRKRFVLPGVLAFDAYDALTGLAARLRSAPRA